jgi:hypothetical protein
LAGFLGSPLGYQYGYGMVGYIAKNYDPFSDKDPTAYENPAINTSSTCCASWSWTVKANSQNCIFFQDIYSPKTGLKPISVPYQYLLSQLSSTGTVTVRITSLNNLLRLEPFYQTLIAVSNIGLCDTISFNIRTQLIVKVFGDPSIVFTINTTNGSATATPLPNNKRKHKP